MEMAAEEVVMKEATMGGAKAVEKAEGMAETMVVKTGRAAVKVVVALEVVWVVSWEGVMAGMQVEAREGMREVRTKGVKEVMREVVVREVA